MKIKKYTLKSSPNISSVNLDQYTSANTSHIGNRKQSHIDDKVYKESIANRINAIKRNSSDNETMIEKIPKTIPYYILGDKAVELGLVDKVG